jgi:hypothetical protein
MLNLGSSRLEQVTKKLNHLQQALVLDQLEPSRIHYPNTQQGIPIQFKPAAVSSSDIERFETTENSSGSSSISFFGLEISDDFSNIESRKLGEVIVSGEAIGDLFLQYLVPLYMKRHYLTYCSFTPFATVTYRFSALRPKSTISTSQVRYCFGPSLLYHLTRILSIPCSTKI